jgi:lysophospholipase L1-like esterase
MRIAAVGDSFVNGTGDPEGLGWIGRACRRARQRGHDVTLYNLGVRGHTSAQVAERFEREAAVRLVPEHSSGLVFSFGANDGVIVDGRARVLPDETLRHARAILERARILAPVLLVGPLPVGDEAVSDRAAALCQMLGALCREVGVPYLPVFDAMRRSAAWTGEVQAGDGAHPGARGYGELADLVDRWPPWRTWLP